MWEWTEHLSVYVRLHFSVLLYVLYFNGHILYMNGIDLEKLLCMIYSVLVAHYSTKAIYSHMDHRLCFISQQNQFLSFKLRMCFSQGSPGVGWSIFVCT